ncbi:MAG: elongation factor P [Proteobacteria bacterium]|nr:elongation factor P [Pseudomonadota bacterium]
MKMNVNDIRVGNVLEHEGRLWRVAKTMHTQPGKGGAFMQVEMKDIVSGTKTNIRYRTAETVERAILEPKNMQFLYADGEQLNFMDMDSYEQVTIGADVVGEQHVWLTENMDVVIEFYDGKPLGVALPETVIMEVVEADAVVKGQTQSSSFKPSKVSNGETVLVPQFVSAGESIVINTYDGTYVERAK